MPSLRSPISTMRMILCVTLVLMANLESFSMTENSELRLMSAYFTADSAWLGAGAPQENKLGLYSSLTHPLYIL